MLQLNFDGKKSRDQNEHIHTVTSAVRQSFFDWNKDLKNLEVSEELVVFVKVIDKVNEKSPDNLVGGHLSIHPSIYPSIHPSLYQSINYFLCGAGRSNVEEHLKKLIDGVKSKCYLFSKFFIN